MLAEPRPARLKALIDEDCVEANRNLSCAHYDSCLDQAMAERWRSWTCASCPVFAARRSPAAGAPAQAATP